MFPSFIRHFISYPDPQLISEESYPRLWIELQFQLAQTAGSAFKKLLQKN